MRAETRERHFGRMEGKEGYEKKYPGGNKSFKDRLDLVMSDGSSWNSMNKG